MQSNGLVTSPPSAKSWKHGKGNGTMFTKVGYLLVLILLTMVLVVMHYGFVVNIGESVVVYREGQDPKVFGKPGVSFTFPQPDRLERIDNKIQSRLGAPTEYYTNDQRVLIVRTFVIYRKAFPAAVAAALDPAAEAAFIDGTVERHLKKAVGTRGLYKTLAGGLDELAATVEEEVAKDLAASSIEVLALRLPLMTIPEENRAVVERRMATRLDEDRRRILAELEIERRRVAVLNAKAEETHLPPAQRDADVIRLKSTVQANALYLNALEGMPEVSRD